MKDIIIIGRKRRYSSVSLNDNNNVDTVNNLNAGPMHDNNGLTLLDSLFHQRRYGERARWPKCVFILMAIGLCSIGTGLFIYFYNPYDVIFKWKLLFAEGGEVFTLWKSPPVDLYVKIYLFNITNSKEFLAGTEKMRVEQVGPYVYKEIITHDQIVFNDNGTVSSVPTHPLLWQEHMSEGHREDDLFTLPNIALLSIAHVASSKSYFFRLPINVLIRQTKSQPFVTTTAKEFMFGYESTLTTLGHNILPNWIYFDKVGLIDRMYDFGGDFATFYTGETDFGAGGLYDTFRGSPKLPQWENDHCNNIQNASDGTKFKSFAAPDEKLLFFRKSMCRAQYMVRVSNETYVDGLAAHRYEFEKNAMDNGHFDERNKCFCRNGQCLPRGLLDVSECYYGFPITLSYPHFYDSEPALLNEVDGLTPNKSEHESYFMINSHSGLPLKLSVKFQINLAMADVQQMAHVGQFSNSVIPMLWFEIMMPALPIALQNRFSMYLNILPVVQSTCLYMCIIGGALLLILAVLKTTWRLSSLITPDISKNNKHLARSSMYLQCEEKLISSSGDKKQPCITDDNVYIDEIKDTSFMLQNDANDILRPDDTGDVIDDEGDVDSDATEIKRGDYTSCDASDYGSCDRNLCELKELDSIKMKENLSYSSTNSSHSQSSSSGVSTRETSTSPTEGVDASTASLKWDDSDESSASLQSVFDDVLSTSLRIIEEDDVLSDSDSGSSVSGNLNNYNHKSSNTDSHNIRTQKHSAAVTLKHV